MDITNVWRNWNPQKLLKGGNSVNQAWGRHHHKVIRHHGIWLEVRIDELRPLWLCKQETCSGVMLQVLNALFHNPIFEISVHSREWDGMATLSYCLTKLIISKPTIICVIIIFLRNRRHNPRNWACLWPTHSKLLTATDECSSAGCGGPQKLQPLGTTLWSTGPSFELRTQRLVTPTGLQKRNLWQPWPPHFLSK